MADSTVVVKLQCPRILLDQSNVNHQIRARQLIKSKVLLKFCCKNGIAFASTKNNDLPLQIKNGLAPDLDHYSTKHIKMILHWELFYCFWFEIWKSKNFKKSFICWLIHIIEEHSLNYWTTESDDDFVYETKQLNRDRTLRCIHSNKLLHLEMKKQFNEEERYKSCKIKINVCIFAPFRVRNLNLESKWSCLLLPLVFQKLCLEYILACLSSLGGAHSSLGEHSKAHAKIAGNISIKQFAIAVKMDDPTLASHCRLYNAHSLMQIGKLKTASIIIRQEYTKVKSNHGKPDPKLISCCKAAWIKLKYLQKRQKEDCKIIS